MKSPPSQTVSLRIDAGLAEQIDAARKPFGISRGEWIRGVVIERIERGESIHDEDQLEELRCVLAEVLSEALRTQTGLNRLAYSLLTLNGQVPSDQAKAIVRKFFAE